MELQASSPWEVDAIVSDRVASGMNLSGLT